VLADMLMELHGAGLRDAEFSDGEPKQMVGSSFEAQLRMISGRRGDRGQGKERIVRQ
jgi:hypothetical protein